MDEPASPPTVEKPADARPRSGRLRRWITFAAVVVLLVWMGRFVWLRLTLRPTPRPQYWAAQITALDPPGPGAITAEQARDALFAFVKAIGSPYSLEDVLSRGWTARHQHVADAVFLSPQFQEARHGVCEAARCGWYEPPDFHELPEPYSSPVRMSFEIQWAVGLIAHARWSAMRGDPDTAVNDFLVALRLARNEMRARTTTRVSAACSVVCCVAGELTLIAREQPKTFTGRTLARPIADILGCEITPQQLLDGERLRINAFLDRWFIRDGGDWFCVSAAVGRGKQPSRLWNLASPLFPSRPGQLREAG